MPGVGSGDAVLGCEVLGASEWDAALKETDLPLRFSHRAEAGRLLERVYPEYEYEPRDFRFADGTRALVPLVRVHRRVEDLTIYLAMPMEWEGTPVVQGGRLAETKIRKIFEVIGGRGGLRIVGGAGGGPPAMGSAGESSTHVLELTPGYEALWENAFSGKNRNSCRKASRSGVAVRRTSSAKAATAYYRIYADATRQWGHDEPPYPKNLVEGLASSENADLWLAYIDDRAVAGALILKGTEDIFYWSGAMDRAHQSASPSNELLRAVLQWACERGYRYMDFGSSKGLPGVKKFKESFGARSVAVPVAEVTGRRHRALEGLLKASRRLRPTGGSR